MQISVFAQLTSCYLDLDREPRLPRLCNRYSILDSSHRGLEWLNNNSNSNNNRKAVTVRPLQGRRSGVRVANSKCRAQQR